MAKPLTIPDEFNTWPRLKQVEHYLECELKIHPCYGPLARCNDPGKQPKWTLEQRLRASRNEVLDHFKNHLHDNVGMVPIGGHCMIDTDASDPEHNREAPVRAFRTLYAELYHNHPFASTWRGDRIPLFVPDVDPAGGKLINPQIIPGLSIEVFIGPRGDTSNVILPPSVHKRGHRYAWEGFGEAVTIGQQPLIGWFGFATKETRAADQEDDGLWKRAFRGDLRTLSTYGLCRELGIYLHELDAEHSESGCAITCPWKDEHTPGKDKSRDTVLLHDLNRVPAFKCLHAHCAHRRIKAFLLWAEERSPGIVDQHCEKTFAHTTVGASDPSYTRAPWPPSTKAPEEFKQVIHYPRDSILETFMDYGRAYTEADDAYLLGTSLSVCATLVGRRVWIPFGERKYLNLFIMLAGKAGSRKSHTIGLGEKLAWSLLQPNRFLAPTLSVEALFDEYSEECGGCADKLLIMDDAANLLSTWRQSNYGERVADVFLRLYDCKGLTEAFRRNKKEAGKTSKRAIPETSTAMLLGATFADALFSGQKAQQGLARRFLYYLSTKPERVIEWPASGGCAELTNIFRSLVSVSGEMKLATASWQMWCDFQHANRARLQEVPDNRPDKEFALSSEPTHVLKIAALFELAIAAKENRRSDGIRPGALELAIDHVAENLRAADYLFKKARLIESRRLAEVVLAKIRAEFQPSKQYPDTIFLTRSRLTYAFCPHPNRRGSINTDNLYLQIIPELTRQGLAQRILKAGTEIYAFRATDDDGPDTPADGQNSPNSPGMHRQPHKDVRGSGGGEFGETGETGAENSPNSPISTGMHKRGPLEMSKTDEAISTFPQIPRLLTPPSGDVDVLSGKPLALDLETCAEVKIARRGVPHITATREALNPWKGEIRLLTLADSCGAIQSFDLRSGGHLPDEICAGLERSPLIVHHACFDLLWLKKHFGIAPAEVFCTLTAARLLAPVRTTNHSLGATLKRYLGVKLIKEHGTSDWGAFVLTDGQIAYAHDDVRHLHKLEATLRGELEHSGLEEVFTLEMNLVPVVVAMEHHGFAVDRGRLEALKEAAKQKGAQLASALRNKFNLPALNPDSPAQLLEALKTAGADIDCTDETALSANTDQRARLIVEYRGAAKLEDSIEQLLKSIAPDGRIHARFNPIGSLAGRFSSKNPNLQNVTRGPLRSCFIASAPDRSLIVADYSQIELRIGAHFAPDEVMMEAFRAKKDLHRATAAAVLSKSVEEVTKDDRQLAKAVNFGFLYGQRPKGFREYARTKYGILLSLDEATRLRTRFFARYRGLASWHQKAWAKAKRGEEEAHTAYGRLLRSQGARDWDRFQLHTNYTVQGSAADVLKVAMVKTAAALCPREVQMVACVHDELIFDCPSTEAEHCRTLIGDSMKQAFMELFGPELPIEVEALVCENWAQK